MGPAVMEAWYYDDHGRVVYHVKGYPSGRRVRDRSGYDFVGDLTALGRTMYDGAGLEEHTEAYAYQYDNWGRLQSTTHTLDGGTPTTLASNTYDSVGRLSGTTRGAIGATPGPASLSSTYAYNVRDWLTENNSPLFSEALTYETPRAGSSFPGQWGGNLSGIQWGSGDSRPYRYDYTYDLLGRLREAAYGGGGNPNLKHGRKYDYDLNGNMTLRRSEELENLHWGAWLDWTWNTDDGNRPEYWHQQRLILNHSFPGESGLTQVQDEAYTYDPVGNRTGTRNMVGDTLNVMRYNLLNLPAEYVSAQGDTVRYVYSADGEKLYVEEKPAGGAVQGTEYAANYRIDNGAVTMIHTDAGYYTPVTAQGGSGVSYSHIWYLKDHLGNNRVLADASGSALKTHHFDPYGMEISVSSTPGFPYTFPSGSIESPYKYGGKEWSTTTSTYDFEARYLSPSFHRFTTMDPLAEKYYSISPYTYCAGNPVNLVDPEGTSIRIRKNQTGALKSLALIAATQRGSHILSAISRRYEIGGHFEPEYILTPVSTILGARFTGREIRYVKDPILPVGNGSADEYAFMGHEIGHAYDHYNGNLRMKNGRPVAGRVSSESRSVTFENYLRSVYGNDKLRTSYSGLNSNPAFSPKTDPYYQERITNFVLLNEDEDGKRLGYSYVSTIDGISVTHFLIVGVDKDDYFYFNVYGSEEEYREASGW
jgi:RHS repeat-associated protein